jgi:hypothetical protein
MGAVRALQEIEEEMRRLGFLREGERERERTQRGEIKG